MVLDSVVKSTGKTQEQLATEMNYGKNYISEVLSPRGKVSKKFYTAFRLKYLENTNNTFHGEIRNNAVNSKRLDDAPQTWEEPTTFYGLKPAGGDYLNKRRAIKNATTIHTAPLVHTKARAGYIKGYHDNDFLETLDRFGLPPGVSPIGAIWRWFEVEGDSMEPNIYSGDIVLGSQIPQEDWANIRNWHTYFIVTDNDIFIKRVYPESASQWILVSDNEAHPAQRMDVSEVKELWVFRRHIKKAVPMLRKFDLDKIVSQLNKDKKNKSKP